MTISTSRPAANTISVVDGSGNLVFKPIADVIPAPLTGGGADGDFEFSISSEVLPDSIHEMDGQAIIWVDGQQIEWV